MKLTKLLIPLVSSVLISTSVYGYEVGDKFPTYPNDKITGYSQWWNPTKEIYGESVFYDLNSDGIPDIYIAQRSCNGRKIRFALFDIFSKELSLDKNTDGVFDEVFEPSYERKIYDDVPVCPKEA